MGELRSISSVITSKYDLIMTMTCIKRTAFIYLLTVNSEIIARVYFRETSRMRSFAKIKPSRNREFTVIYHGPVAIFLRRKYVFNAIRENKILAIFFESTRIFKVRNHRKSFYAILTTKIKPSEIFKSSLLAQSCSVPDFQFHTFK